MPLSTAKACIFMMHYWLILLGFVFHYWLFLAVISVLYLTAVAVPEIHYSGAVPLEEDGISTCAQDWLASTSN